MWFANFGTTLLEQNLSQVAVRFKNAVRHTVESLRQRPRIGARYRSSDPQLSNLRSWPVAGFEIIRIFYLVDKDDLPVIRVLHGKRDLKSILEPEKEP